MRKSRWPPLYLEMKEKLAGFLFCYLRPRYIGEVNEVDGLRSLPKVVLRVSRGQ